MDNDEVSPEIYSDQTCRYELSPDIDSDNINLPIDRSDDRPIDPPETDSGGVKDNNGIIDHAHMDNDEVSPKIYSDQTCRYELGPDIDSDDNIDLPVDLPDIDSDDNIYLPVDLPIDRPDDRPIDPPETDSGGVKLNAFTANVSDRRCAELTSGAAVSDRRLSVIVATYGQFASSSSVGTLSIF
ncbi:hypothetical protein J6590_067457 [Homalodisca vitripennis]|nr:hypothetical protein J6590_067457 [Homalodisca vitripennis]